VHKPATELSGFGSCVHPIFMFTGFGYATVWLQDEAGTDPVARADSGVEPVSAVLRRGLDTLRVLEQRYAGERLLLVSHGDLVQILQTAFAGLAACEHRRLAHHRTAEIRPLAGRGQPWPSLA
jgi:probable phosphoglycerate mutase